MKVVASIVVAAALGLAPSAFAQSVPLPPVMPPVVYGPCPYDANAFGCFVDETIYLQARDHFSLVHEIGHAFDEQVMTRTARAQFERLLRLVGAGREADWWSDSYAPPAELFADAYAACRLKRDPDHGIWTESYGYHPSERTHRRVCALIRTAALDHAD